MRVEAAVAGALAAAAAAGGALYLYLDRYRVTSHGPNPWLPGALVNVLTHAWMFERARAAVGGTFNSVYRHPDVNARIAGSSATSRHMEGLAVDLRPGPGWNATSAAARLWELAKSGDLGDVHQVIDEESWVHVGWQRPDKPQSLVLLRMRGGSYEKVATV